MASTNADELFERNPIIETFGTSGAMRIAITLIDGGGSALTVSRLADQADVSRQTVYNNIDTLIDANIVEEAGGAIQKYRAILDSDTTQALMDLYDSLIDATAEESG